MGTAWVRTTNRVYAQAMSLVDQSNFPDYVAPTTIAYNGAQPSLRMRSCTLVVQGGGSHHFEADAIRVGAMGDNDLVIHDEIASRYHCKIVQEDTGYVLIDLDSTNGTYIDGVRIREGYLHPGCTIGIGESRIQFQPREESVAITPSQSDRCGYIIGGNQRMREIYTIIEKIAPTAATVVIEGETGTGKEVVAQTLHSLSPRAAKELIVFDCSAVPPNLIESELFGHEKGSFTGAVMTRKGLFEMADGGTLFLDELGELPLELQPKLLRALEKREVRRVGATRTMKVDVRIIAATNRDLRKEVRERRFRQDLYYRLSVVKLHLPSLADRTDDIPLLGQHFLQHGGFNRAPDGSQRVTSMSHTALACLQSYHWPGNIRELINVIERAVSFSDGRVVDERHLPDYIRESHRERQGFTGGRAATAVAEHPQVNDERAPRMPVEIYQDGVRFKDAKERWVASFERDYIVSLLKRHHGNITHAARDADIDRKYFRKLMKKYDIEASEYSSR